MTTKNTLLKNAKTVPTILLSNTLLMSMIGLGTWRLNRNPTDVIYHAIDVGYRHFDCAHIYRNEAEIVDYVDTWKAMEPLVDEGLCRTLGLSNFNIQQIGRILKVARIPPSNLQIECHPYLNQTDLMEFCKSYNMVVTAYSPLGSPSSPYKYHET
uniref:NADP-dependent oxidoreductase domain-containing protein n=1 Tax=Glossina brevipalpis TaxID=37001 RepID=A0A1A9W746_9MUSC